MIRQEHARAVLTAGLIAALLWPASFAVAETPANSIVAAPAPTVSRPGAYSGWSPSRFDGTVLASRYVTMRDGTRIAIDVIRPTLHGQPATEPLPVLWMNTPYDRRRGEGGDTARNYPGAALALARYGYVIAVADMRGNYASFGTAVFANRNEWMPWAYWDAYDITEWLAAQPWSDGKIGMWGCSATGHSQWQAAATRPPHLKAIFPMSAPSEYYDWGGMVPPPAAAPPPRVDERPATPVDADPDGVLVAQARAEHQANFEPGTMPYRDSVSPEMARRLGLKDYRYWLEVSTLSHLQDIAASGIPAYQSANYGEDIRVKQGVFLKRANLPGQVKTIIAPGNHCEWSSDFVTRPGNGFNIVTEERRWFDYWLKGIANGVMTEPSIFYYTINAAPGDEWRSAWQWPLPTEHRVSYFFAAGQTVHAGSLTTAAPREPGGADRYVTNYNATTADIDSTGQTYTTAPLPADTTLAGHTIVDLWIASTAPDGDFVAWLEDVAPDGHVIRLPGTEDGRLRASHRALGNASFATAGLPWHRSFAGDIRPLVPGQPAELRFDLAPVSYVFGKGHRIRIAMAGVAQDRHSGKPLTPVLDPAPVVMFLRDPQHPSRVELPLSAPVAATARVSHETDGLLVWLDFPASLDARYLDDVTPGSVRLGTVQALSMQHDGQSLALRFPANTPVRPGEIVVGRFGGRYDYGDEARFVAKLGEAR